jgi:formamidopyrimidine-DNA glycosylase
LEKIRLENIFVLRTAVPPIDSLHGRKIVAVRRLGKRIPFGFEGDRWLVLHLMIAGRLQWAEAGVKPKATNALAHFFFANGVLTLTEAGTKRRASLHVLDGEAALRTHDLGGIDVLACTT